MTTTRKYGNGKFEFVKDKSTRELFQNAHWAISETGMWDWMANYEVDEEQGFTFSSGVEFEIIGEKMREQDVGCFHSGYSYGVTMRSMHHIAKNGYDAFREKYVRLER